MAGFSKYFYEAVQNRSCADYFHPNETCWENQRRLLPKIITGTLKYYLPILLLPTLAKYDKWSPAFWKSNASTALRALVAMVVPVITALTCFCGLFDLLKRHYYTFYVVPLALSQVVAALAMPSKFCGVLAIGGCNHLIEFLLESLNGTVFQGLKTNVTFNTLTFMTSSAAIVYLFKTSRNRPYWLLHVPLASAAEKEQLESETIQRRRPYRKVCDHENSCTATVWSEVKKATTIGLAIGLAKSVLSNFDALKLSKIHQLPAMIAKNFEFSSMLFLVTYCGSFKLLNCLINRYFGRNSNRNGIMAGFLSGAAYSFYPRFIMNSFGMMRACQLAWLKYIEDYKGPNKHIRRLQGLPMERIIFMVTASILFIGRIMFPFNTSNYIVMTLNYLTGNITDIFTANYYGILMGLQ